MKMIKFTKAMAPHGVGDTRVVPDDMADRLIKEGVAEFEPNVIFDAKRKEERKRFKIGRAATT